MINVAILYGGPSAEHKVSVASAKNILEHIDRSFFNVTEVYITKDLTYQIDWVDYSEEGGMMELLRREIEVVFPLLHGAYGEDGVLQKKLEDRKIAFVGSSSRVSSVTINKKKTNEILEEEGFLIPKSHIVKKDRYWHECSYPVIVKPVDQGSSIGLLKFKNEEEYLSSLETIFKERDHMLIQEFVDGREFTCGVVEKGKEMVAFVATEVILTKGEMFDYDAKYSVDGCKEITPAEVDEVLMRRIQEVSVRCHAVLGCRSVSRTDMIFKDNDLYILEINTMPGMTKTSFIPAQAEASGYDIKGLISMLIVSAKNYNHNHGN